jgi:hypothetical protein
VIGAGICLPVKVTVKSEHCEAAGGKTVMNEARAEQMMDAKMDKMVQYIELGMIG